MPAVVDLAAMRDAMADLGGDPAKINPLVPAELVIDHSVQVDVFGTRDAFAHERRARVRAQQRALPVPALGPGGVRQLRRRPARHRDRPPGQPRVPRARGLRRRRDRALAYPDTLVGTDSHTTMVNGLGVLGWGVGGIEAEAAMLGQPMSMLIPQVIGFKLTGELPEGATATDLVLTVTELLRQKGVVGKFVEFYGPGVSALPLADRATIGNMSPEFGSTCAIFPIDAETLRYLAFSGRPKELIDLVEAYAKEQGLWHDENSRGADVLRHRRARPRRRSCRRSPGPSARRTACRWPAPRTASAPRWPSSSARTPGRRSPTATTRRWPRPSRPRDPPANGAPGPRGRPERAVARPRGGGRRDGRRRARRPRSR